MQFSFLLQIIGYEWGNFKRYISSCGSGAVCVSASLITD